LSFGYRADGSANLAKFRVFPRIWLGKQKWENIGGYMPFCSNSIPSYYKPSGKYSKSFLWYFLLSLPILGILSLIFNYIPYVSDFGFRKKMQVIAYILDLGTYIVLFFAFMGIMSFVVKLGKARNPRIVLVCTIIAAFVYLFCDSIDFDEIEGFEDIVSCIGIVLCGTIVWIVLVFLLSKLFPIPIWPIIKSKYPFSEKADNWYAKMNNLIEIDMPENFDDIKKNMEKGDFTELIRLAKEKKEIDTPESFEDMKKKVKNGELTLTEYSQLLKEKNAELDKPRFDITFYEPPQPSSGEPYYLTMHKMKLSYVDSDGAISGILKGTLEWIKDAKEKLKQTSVYLAIDKQSVMEIIQAKEGNLQD